MEASVLTKTLVFPKWKYEKVNMYCALQINVLTLSCTRLFTPFLAFLHFTLVCFYPYTMLV